MRDWRSEASGMLANSKLAPAERDEVSRELAGYLEDLCSDAPAHGLDESATTQKAAAELHEDRHLGVHLYRARREGTMNDRTKQLWLPGGTVLLVSGALLAIFQLAGLSPYFPRAWAANSSAADYLHRSFMIYVPWLCVLPFLGAAGAHWSRRAGSGRSVQAAVGLFPALVFLGALLTFLMLALAMGTLPPVDVFAPAFAGLMLSWVVVPGAALLVGIVPFLMSSSATRRLPS